MTIFAIDRVIEIKKRESWIIIRKVGLLKGKLCVSKRWNREYSLLIKYWLNTCMDMSIHGFEVCVYIHRYIVLHTMYVCTYIMYVYCTQYNVRMYSIQCTYVWYTMYDIWPYEYTCVHKLQLFFTFHSVF